jgi:hypothetical protein
MPRHLLLGWALSAVACAKEREPAPTEMKALAAFLFENWEDAAVLPEAVDNMGDWVFDNVDSEDAEKGFQLDSIPAAAMNTVPHPDVPNETLGVVGAARSPFGLEQHATHMPLKDQIWSNPKMYERYERTLLEGTASTFEAEDVRLRTSNAITTSTLGVTIPYVLFKDYQWVAGERHDAIVARSWVAERSCGDTGENCVDHTYSVDMWFADGPDAAVRATASWSQLETFITFGEDTQVATLALGIQNVFEYTDRFLAGDE